MKPIAPYLIEEGGTYWAAWGSKGWSAVIVVAVRRNWADVERVDPISGKPTSAPGTVRLDEMVQRDPTKRGKDRPMPGPAYVFSQIRSERKAGN